MERGKAWEKLTPCGRLNDALSVPFVTVTFGNKIYLITDNIIIITTIIIVPENEQQNYVVKKNLIGIPLAG